MEYIALIAFIAYLMISLYVDRKERTELLDTLLRRADAEADRLRDRISALEGPRALPDGKDEPSEPTPHEIDQSTGSRISRAYDPDEDTVQPPDHRAAERAAQAHHPPPDYPRPGASEDDDEAP